MKGTVYIETSVISYLASRPSRDLVVAANQRVTLEWWEAKFLMYDAYISQVVVEEASMGDPDAAKDRLGLIESIPLLELNDHVLGLASRLLKRSVLPERAVRDALHIAVATVHGMDYLLTWNCRHIANALIRSAITGVCLSEGYETPVICTPLELLGE
jgi:predicted nucleic acid-binding protein